MITVLAVVTVVVAVGLRIELRSRFRRHGWHRIGYRWFTGKAWHGQPVDPAVWRWPGRWFWQMSQPKRAGVRVLVSAAGGGSIALWIFSPHAADLVFLSISFLVSGALLCMGAWLAVTWSHRRKFVNPLRAALTERHGLHRPPKISRARDQVVLPLPRHWAGDSKERAAIVEVVVAKTGIEGAEARWRLAGPAPQLMLTVAATVPARVTLADVRAAIDAAKADDLIWGLGRGGKPVRSSLASDSPHIGVSAGSGGGKSIEIRFLISQMLYHGAIALIIDYKQLSHNWARDLPNVSIVRHPFEIHAALLWLGREIGRRNAVALAGADLEGNVHATVGPRLIIVGEELNATMKALRAYWRQMRDEDKSLQVRSPALDAFDMVNLMGRQVLMNAMYVGQKLSVKATGGDGDIRESIGVIAMGRYRASTWKQLAEDHPMPPPTRKPGRFQIVADDVHEVQGAYISAVEARELALAGTVSALPAGMPGAPRVAAGTHEAILGPEQAFVSGTSPVVAPVRGLVTLSEAVEQQLVRRGLYAVRKQSQRDPAFPPRKGLRGTAALYDATDLITWDES